MKRIFAIILILSWTFVQAQPSGIKISTNTFNLCVNGSLKKIVLARDNFYCMFETGRENTSRTFKKILIFNKKGDFIEEVFVPLQIQKETYYDLKIENDSLFVQGKYYKNTFVLGMYVADFKLIESRNFKIFQDSSYKVYSTCNGEWGGTIYFQDKETKEVFEAASTCTILINKIGDEYFVTNYLEHMFGFTSILKISDPTKLQKSKLDFDKEHGSEHQKGVEILFDSTGFYIPTSFVVEEQLLHIYSDEKGTYIGKIENGIIIPIYQFDYKFYAHFNQQNEKGQQVLGFNMPDSDIKGILVIDKQNLNLYFINSK